MTYIDPKIYNRQNLSKEDHKICDLIYDFCDTLIDNTEIEETFDNDTILDQIKNDVIKEFCVKLRERLGYDLQDMVISMIECYPEDVKISEIEHPETYFYKGK